MKLASIMTIEPFKIGDTAAKDNGIRVQQINYRGKSTGKQGFIMA